MKRVLRIVSALLIAALSVGTAAAATSGSGIVTGTLKDLTGAPIAGASVTLKGPSSYAAQSDAKGTFTLSGVAPGVYLLRAAKPGYTTASQVGFTVLDGQTQAVQITMEAQSFSSLQTIATVRSRGRDTFNTGTASISSVSSQDFQDQGNDQVMRQLNQIPGIQASFSGGDANAAVPGAITYPTIRGSLGYETASLIDGHPLSVGAYGNYVTTFLNSFVLQSAEVVKGPGAMSPETNYAIGGTVNFRTKDPTLRPTADYTLGVDNFGGAFSNLGFSDTVLNGRLGFVADIAQVNKVSALNNTPTWFDPATDGVLNGTVLTSGHSQSIVPGTASLLYNRNSFVACCYDASGSYSNISELFKVRYKLSPVTSLTASYFGGQSSADQRGNVLYSTPTLFVPPAGYSGPLAPNSDVLLTKATPGGPILETNNEPIFQAEFLTTHKNDTILARFYHADISRIIQQGPSSVDGNYPATVQLYGGLNPLTGLPYNGQSQTINFYDYFNETQVDHLVGYSLEYDHPFSLSNTATVSWNYTRQNSIDYESESDDASASAAGSPPRQGDSVVTTTEIPSGAQQIFNTFLFRDTENFTDKLSGVLSLYENTYNSQYPVSHGTGPNGGNPLPDDPSWVYNSATHVHLDDRAALTYRPSSNWAIRASAGSAIAPPYLALLSAIPGTASYSSKTDVVTQTVGSGTLYPETAFGYDLGADHRLKDGVTYISGDVYITDLYNHYITQTFNSGLTCGNGYTCPASAPNGTPVYYTSTVNLNNARFEGLELQVRRVPEAGFGYNVSGSLLKAYAYNLPACFYSNSNVCTVTATNLGIVAGQNFQAVGLGAVSGYGYNTFQSSGSTSIPYFMGNASIDYHSHHGFYASFGETLYGKNNSLNEPPFALAYATVRVPLGHTMAFQISGDNLFNALDGVLPIYGGGVPSSLATNPVYGGVTLPAAAATIGNVLGPASYRFEITKYLGSK